MINLQKLIPKEILIRLTEDGFVSTVTYCGLFANSAAWRTCPAEEAEAPALLLIRRAKCETTVATAVIPLSCK